ncbi:hypothetical protein N7537_012172 [Penicillium hordei]|uniref:Uncharacterized protein n=1 Tax=Penicillium hordei TaxID=40994 RepID=A0AAD6DPP0_9EURO|nr:uncharacterized protein N7537_012172 [Penicillium hordei]KAJ5589494.1 hypothetical protein N7537_012172 [Penicillium hordei]
MESRGCKQKLRYMAQSTKHEGQTPALANMVIITLGYSLPIPMRRVKFAVGSILGDGSHILIRVGPYLL